MYRDRYAYRPAAILAVVALAIGLLVGSLTALAAGDKVTVCHAPPGNVAQTQEIDVGSSALQTHLDHGDKTGACPVATMPPATEASEAPPTPTPTTTPPTDEGNPVDEELPPDEEPPVPPGA